MNFILWDTGTEPEHHLILATLTEAVFDIHFRHKNDVGNGDFLSENTLQNNYPFYYNVLKLLHVVSF